MKENVKFHFFAHGCRLKKSPPCFSPIDSFELTVYFTTEYEVAKACLATYLCCKLEKVTQ
jgi:hypothetical protein